MLWTTSLILLVLWLLALLLDVGGPSAYMLPVVIGFLILARVVSGARLP